MFGFLNSLMGGTTANFEELIANGAVILDVRTKEEYQQGHIKDSLNIPLDKLENNIKKLNKNKVIITCCASGGRSSVAKGILKNHGFEVHNGGGWYSLQRYC